MGKDILSPKQKQVLNILANDENFRENFFFTGGTPLAAYYLNHRYSEDLDFFSQQEIDLIWLNSLKGKTKEMVEADEADLKQSFNRNLVFFKFDEEVLKTEFTHFPFESIDPPVVISGIKTDSIKDISVNKFFALYQKPAARHFIDLYLILKRKEFAWEDLAKLARIKFDTPIDPIQLGAQLVTAETISDLPKMIISLEEKEWRSYFLDRAKELKTHIS